MLPKANWLIKIHNVRLVSFAIIGALLFGLLPLFMLATTIISKPLNRLYKSMMKFKNGDFEQRIEVTNYDEIGEVTQCFNEMVTEIKELIDTNYVMVLRERQSELDALQAQINPHFLYNALDSLYWQALNTGSEKLAEDIYSLSQLFRLVLSQGQSMIPIAKEKDLIYHYLQIQKMRFEKKLNFTIDMDEAILEYKIPKLIMQPFVENAIVHGLEHTGAQGLIEIKGHQKDGYIILEVKDNGIGMTQEQLKEVFEKEENKEYSSQRIGRYAIKNIKERLNLKYHDNFELKIQSKVGVGTTVTMILPARFE
jgi:two-component system sensor histidine kinase YesM